MIHTFAYQNDYFVLDTESGSVHNLDKAAFDVLRCVEEGGDPAAELAYTRSEIEEILDEVEELKDAGLLFSELAYDPEKPVFSAPAIKSMCLHIAHDCNLRCAYCFGDKGAFSGSRELMSPEVAKKALDLLMRTSAGRRNLEVDFFGGEPLINFDTVKQAVAYGRKLEKEYGKNIRFTMTTNAYHVTDEMADFINAEMKNLVISIDGRQEVHDALRKTAGGQGSYAKTVANAQKLIRARGDGEYYIRGTFTRLNTDFSRDAEALCDLGFDQISLEPVVTQADMGLTAEHLPEVLEEYEHLAAIYEQRRAEGRPFHFFHFNVDLTSGPCMNKRLRGCGAGSEYAAVSPSGELYPCHQFVGKKEFLLGSVDEGITHPEIAQKFMDCHVWNKQPCRECWAKYYCSGGCAANSYNMNGDMMQPYEIGCVMEKKRIELAIALKLREETSHETETGRADARI